MFGLGIRYLMGWAMAASDGADKKRAEWPPHPDRVFMALAAAWFETGESPVEGEALRWLEKLESPAISASNASFRRAANNDAPPICYVPVNDTASPMFSKGGKEKVAQVMGSLSIGRDRKDRRFAVSIPESDVVYLVWSGSDPGSHREALLNLARKVTYIGHSASLVQMWITDTPPKPNWAPTEGVATHRLRVFGPGRLEHLKERCNKNDAVRYGELAGDRGEIETLSEKRKTLDEQRRTAVSGLRGAQRKTAEAVFVEATKAIDAKMAACQQELQKRYQGRKPVSLRPEPGLWKGYDRPVEQVKDDTSRSIFDPRLMILTLSGKKLSLSATLKLTETMRGALFATCPQPIPEWLSGHTTDGKPTALPHTAFIPLPFVGSNHADGRLMGIGLALPRDLDPSEASRCLDPILWDMETGAPAQIHLFAGQWFECQAEQEQRESPPWNLRAEAWTAPSRIWASITPVTLDRHFDGKDKWEQAAESVKDSCERIGLPRPNEVVLHPVSLVEGVPHTREFPCLTRKMDGGRMHHSHAVIVFEKPVFGPVLVGAGRYRGYGLCRPMDKREAEYA